MRPLCCPLVAADLPRGATHDGFLQMFGGGLVGHLSYCDRMLTSSLENVLNGYLSLRWKLDPVLATSMGIRDHDSELADWSAEGLRSAIAALRSYTAALEEAGAESLDDEIERTAVLHAARHDLLRLEQVRPQSRDPGHHLRHLVGGVHMLLVRLADDPAPRTAAIIARLQAAPEFLATAQSVLTEPAPYHLASARQILRGAIALVRDGIHNAPLDLESTDASVFESARDGCVHALLEFSDWLELAADDASGTHAVGRKIYDALLHTAHMVQEGADELARYGERLRLEAIAALEQAAQEIQPGSSWKEVASRLESDRPAGRETLRILEDCCRAAREFVRDRNLLDLDDRGSLLVEPTPDFLRTVIPVAAYLPPGPFEQSQDGRFLVTVEDGEGHPGSGQFSRRAELPLLAVHEGVPGHHTHILASNASARSARKALRSPVSLEGWALYAETLLQEEGFFQEPEQRFAAARFLLWRALRIELDVGLHTRDLSPEAAADQLATTIGLSPEVATAEIRRQCSMPTYAVCYAIGRREILDIRDAARARDGGEFSLAAFHRELFQYGALPPALARWGMGLA